MSNKNSYSQKTKETLSVIPPKKKCCRRIQEDILALSLETDFEKRSTVLASVPEHMKCQGCASRALASLFIVFGSVTDPSKQYHLDLSFETEKERDFAERLTLQCGILMKKSVRKNRYILYIKDSSKIEDFFAITGANKAAFELMNSKIIREVRGNANRQINCDMANISKSIAAAERMSDMVSEMEACGAILRLPEELRQTALLRIENTQASMAELGSMHNPCISKSGVKHRLDKICEFYNKYKNEK